MCWQKNLSQTLSRLTASPPPRVAVVGIGHDLRGDDAAGLMVARSLMPACEGAPHVLVLEGGPAPENTTGALRRFAPELVVLVDAAQMNAPAGTINWLDPLNAAGFSASSHTMPLSVLARFLQMEIGCQVTLLGIQPGSLQMNADLSDPVMGAVREAVEQLANNLMNGKDNTHGKDIDH